MSDYKHTADPLVAKTWLKYATDKSKQLHRLNVGIILGLKAGTFKEMLKSFVLASDQEAKNYPEEKLDQLVEVYYSSIQDSMVLATAFIMAANEGMEVLQKAKGNEQNNDKDNLNDRRN